MVSISELVKQIINFLWYLALMSQVYFNLHQHAYLSDMTFWKFWSFIGWFPFKLMFSNFVTAHSHVFSLFRDIQLKAHMRFSYAMCVSKRDLSSLQSDDEEIAL
jgi:hypothetical protein